MNPMKPFTTPIAGVTFRDGYPENLLRLQVGQELVLIPDPTNEFDPYACRVVARYVTDVGDGEGTQVFEELGYLPRGIAKQVYDLVHEVPAAMPHAYVADVKDYGYDDIGVDIRVVPPEARAGKYAGARSRVQETATEAEPEVPDLRFDDRLAVLPPRVSDARVQEIAHRFEARLDDIVDAWSGAEWGIEREVDAEEWVGTVRDIIEEYVGGLFGIED